MRSVPHSLAAFSLVLAVACGHASPSSTTSARTGVSNAERASIGRPTRSLGGEAADAGTAESAAYGDTARTLYEDALDEFRRGDCIDAEPIFRRVRREFPYSRYAALSDLRVGDCQMKSKSYPEAIQTFTEFVRYRPSHAMVAYARFRIAESHFEQIPSDWFLVPPSYERDLAEAQDALRLLRRFILDFPEDEHLERALEMARRALRVLAGHELYVAKFYARRDAREAVVTRLETMLRTYEGSGLEPEALLLLGDAYRELRLPAQARAAYQQLVERFPESSEASSARSHLRDRALRPTPESRTRDASAAPAAPATEPETAADAPAVEPTDTSEAPEPDAVVTPRN